jgi:hypothetical protein
MQVCRVFRTSYIKSYAIYAEIEGFVGHLRITPFYLCTDSEFLGPHSCLAVICQVHNCEEWIHLRALIQPCKGMQHYIHLLNPHKYLIFTPCLALKLISFCIDLHPHALMCM